MTLHPEVLKKAQTEIDTVIGNDRLPGIEDRGQLPYIDALVKEVFRWNSVVPLGKFLLDAFTKHFELKIDRIGVPHRSVQDDVHEGYFIPKGSLIIPNIW
ncbi:hypothetical protein PM082_005004 [Marasmius tenuissimus]|nr:hypothetical protein PM082_005004 [Marasmius tenuissimus]